MVVTALVDLWTLCWMLGPEALPEHTKLWSILPQLWPMVETVLPRLLQCLNWWDIFEANKIFFMPGLEIKMSGLSKKILSKSLANRICEIWAFEIFFIVLSETATDLSMEIKKWDAYILYLGH